MNDVAERAYAEELDAIRSLGFEASIEHTGGGCLAIYVTEIGAFSGSGAPYMLVTTGAGPLVGEKINRNDPEDGWMIGYYSEENEWYPGDADDSYGGTDNGDLSIEGLKRAVLEHASKHGLRANWS